MSISPITLTDITTYYQLIDPTAKIFKKQLEDLGYTSTGDVNKDKLLLSMLKHSAQKTEFTKSQSAQALPWQEILDALGLTSKGNKSDDYELIMSTIAEKLEYATNEDEKKYYLDLIQRTDNAFTNSFDNSSLDQASANMTGASYLSSLNQYFML